MNDWSWDCFAGDAETLRYMRRDLPNLEKILTTYVHSRGVAVQAGGNLGIYPKYLAERFDLVYTFEPDPRLFSALMWNAREENIIRFQAAVGCKKTLVGTSKSRRDGKKNVHDGVTHVTEKGPYPTLLIDELGLQSCDLIYLDVEGYEHYALQGARTTMTRHHPVVVCEVNHQLQYHGFVPEDIRQFFRLHEYDFAERVGSDEVFLPRRRNKR